MRRGRLPAERMYPAGVPGIATRRVTLPDGLTLRVVESGSQHDRSVIMVHGWGASIYSFAETIPAVAGAGYRVLAIDLPGFGLSDKPTDERKYGTRYLGACVELAAQAVGARRFTLVAHSMAGAIALQLALRGVSGMERLVLINPVGLGRVWGAVKLLRLVSASFMDVLARPLLTRGLVRTILRVAFATPQRPTVRDVDEYWAPSQFDEYATACRACLRHFDWKPIPADVLAGLSLPVLVLVGARDRLVRRVEERARAIPNARIATIPEGGHILMQECAERTNHEIIRFLRAWA